MQFLRKLKTILGLGIIIAVLWLSNNYGYNRHSHILPDGRIIYHSHPVNKHNDCSNPVNDHSHDDNEYFLLSQISQFYLLQLTLFKVEDAEPQFISTLINVYARELYQAKFLRITDLRAPPSIS